MNFIRNLKEGQGAIVTYYLSRRVQGKWASICIAFTRTEIETGRKAVAMRLRAARAKLAEFIKGQA